MKKYKDNVIPFPTKEEIEFKEAEKELDEMSNECVDASHFLMEVLEEFILTGQVNEDFQDMNFRDETLQESRDMFVVVNLLNAMFNRYYGIEHGLHQTLDNAYVKIKEMILINEKAQKDLYLFKPEDSDIEFTFEPDGDDDDDGPV
tara:strand:- start:13823 stop:14260 length:438 start_codon:yes stop_codon:yes gene_type:complete